MHSFSDLETALSLERFGRYMEWADQDRAIAIDLYTLNTQISESLYTPMQMLEVALRNRIHAVMTSLHHEAWFTEAGALLGDYQPNQVTQAISDIQRERKDPTPGRVVAALTFSFWTAMFGKAYETVWQQGLHRIAARPDGKGMQRKDFSAPLTRIRILRNRIAHHEPIVHWDLHKAHDEVLALTRWLSPAAADWCQAHTRFASVCPDPESAALLRCRGGR